MKVIKNAAPAPVLGEQVDEEEEEELLPALKGVATRRKSQKQYS